jgi:hypothetical protein
MRSIFSRFSINLYNFFPTDFEAIMSFRGRGGGGGRGFGGGGRGFGGRGEKNYRHTLSFYMIYLNFTTPFAVCKILKDNHII